MGPLDNRNQGRAAMCSGVLFWCAAKDRCPLAEGFFVCAKAQVRPPAGIRRVRLKKTGIILAAGDGTRMKSNRPKVLHEAGGAPMLEWVLEAMRGAGLEDIVAVVGAGADEVRAAAGNSVRYATQEKRLGTGHAVQMAAPLLPEGPGYVFIAAGDMPLITQDTIRHMMTECAAQSADCTLLSAVVHDPDGYGRVIRAEDGQVVAIIEHKDASSDQRLIREVNASCYCVRTELLLEILPHLSNENAQGEYYLTDIVELIRRRGGVVSAYTVSEEECLGVNNNVQLYEASKILYMRTARRHMLNGVKMIDAAAVYVDPKTTIGAGTTVYPGVVLEKGCTIGTGVMLYPGSRIQASSVGDETVVQNSVVLEASVGSNSLVGPYAFLRPGTNVGSRCRVGDFVELKNCTLGDDTKVSHLTYIGDADFGSGINVGCGVVVVNYDGKDKFRSAVGDNAFIGCNTNLISPVSVGSGAYIAAGSTVTEDVPSNAFAIARARQVNKTEWHDKRDPDQ